MKLWMKILIALFLGVVAGEVLGPNAEFLKPIGTLFLNMASMIIVPLVFASMVVCITSIHDPHKLGRIGLKTLGLYLLTTTAAIVIGIALAKLFHLGQGMNLHLPPSAALIPKTPQLVEILLSLIPNNPFAALSSGNILQIIVFAIFLGIATNFAGERGKPLLEFFESLADVMYRLTAIVMEFSPIGVFSIVAWAAGSFGFLILLPLAVFLTVYCIACLVHVFVIFCPILYLMAKVHPWPFFRGMGDAIMIAFSTCSSLATLPVSMHCVHKNLGVSKNITGFVLPLGSTINMNGAALFQGMGALFIAQAYGIDLSWQSLVIVWLASVVSSAAAAGIPGTGFIIFPLVLDSIGLPLESLALFAGIDRLREMPSTVLNVLGNGVCAVYVASKEGEIDERQYYHKESIEIEGNEV